MDKDFLAIYNILETAKNSIGYWVETDDGVVHNDNTEQILFSGKCVIENKNRLYRLIEMLFDNGYLRGEAQYDWRYKKIVKVTNLQITLKGMEYLELNPIMRRAAGKIG